MNGGERKQRETHSERQRTNPSHWKPPKNWNRPQNDPPADRKDRPMPVSGFVQDRFAGLFKRADADRLRGTPTIRFTILRTAHDFERFRTRMSTESGCWIIIGKRCIYLYYNGKKNRRLRNAAFPGVFWG
jgi:hypothetical protein